MSEYQYYEFLAIDQPLSAADKRWLRDISTRAEITSTSLTNTYHWGDFKGDPYELLRRCFDAHVYVSNFGVQDFMVKLARDEFDCSAAAAYVSDTGVALTRFKNCVVLSFGLDDEPDNWDAWDDGSGWMASLAPLRDDLLNGDWRALYLAWLLNVQYDCLEPEESEPPVPAGLGSLSAPCEALIDFLSIDRTLVEVAAEGSMALVENHKKVIDWGGYVTGLKPDKRDALLLRLLKGDDPALRRELSRELRSKKGNAGGSRSASTGRTVGALAEEWQRRVELGRKRAAEVRAREAKQLAEEWARAREEHLCRLVDRGEGPWTEVNLLIRTRTANSYDEATTLLVDLRDAAALDGRETEFAKRLAGIRTKHKAKYTLIRRLDAAGLE